MRNILTLLLSLLIGSAHAGTNTLPIQTGAIVQRAHINKYQTALTGDFVPRNSSGVPTASAGELGTSAFPWASTYTRELNLFGLWNGNAITLAPPSPLPTPYVLTFPSALPDPSPLPMVVQPSGEIEFSKITQHQLAPRPLQSPAPTNTPAVAGGIALSASSGDYSTSSSSFTDVTNLAVSIITTGRPVFVGLINDGSATSGSYIGATGSSGSSPSARFRITRGGTEISSAAVFSLGGGTSIAPVGSFWFLDRVASGTYTYVVQALAISGSANVRRARLVAYEL